MKTLKQLHRPLSNDFFIAVATFIMLFLSGFVNPVNVMAQPVIKNFTAWWQKVCPPPAVVTFHNYVKGNYILGDTLTYQWDFGDGNFTTTECAYGDSGCTNMSHTYVTASLYPAQLIVIGPDGLSDTAYLTITISNSPCPPYINYVSVYPTTACAPKTVSMSVSSKGGDYTTGDTVTYQWNFGDGNAVITTAPTDVNGNSYSNTTNAYTTGGTYIVQVIATGPNGASDTAFSKPIILNFAPCPPNISYFYPSGSNWECAPFTTTIYGNTNGNDDAVGGIMQYQWYFGDGNNQSTTAIIDNNGNSYSSVNHTYSLAGNYSLQLIVTAPNGQSDTVFYSSISVYDSCGTITGTFYLDLDNDCIFDANEDVLANAGINLIKNGNSFMWDYTDANGIYSFEAPFTTDTYAVTIANWFWMGGGVNSFCICPSSMQYNNITQPSVGLDFGYHCGLVDASFSYFTPSGIVTPGTASMYYVIICNNGFVPVINGIYYVIYNPLLTYDSATITPAYVSSDTIAWNFSNLAPSECINMFFWLNTPPIPTVNLGDTFCIYGFVQTANDVNPSNDYRDRCYVIGGAYDPNNMLVNPPVGFGEFAKVNPSQPSLHYEINFQNTGTAAATNIFIMDTLDAMLDIGTLRLGSSSHSFELEVAGNNILKFNFNNIMLPDSGSNQDASHGFVDYSIGIKPGFQHGDMIKAHADIFFDFNPAIITNEAIVVADSTVNAVISVKQVSGKNFFAYPNPFANRLNISYYLNEPSLVSLDIFDAHGKKVKTFADGVNQDQGNYHYNFNADNNSLSGGLYFIRFSANGDVNGKKVFMVK